MTVDGSHIWIGITSQRGRGVRQPCVHQSAGRHRALLNALLIRCAGGPYSKSPRRIASATAAFRSDTPSFSYNRWVWVFTVLHPIISSAATWGIDRELRLLGLELRRSRRALARWMGAQADLPRPGRRRLGRHNDRLPRVHLSPASTICEAASIGSGKPARPPGAPRRRVHCQCAPTARACAVASWSRSNGLHDADTVDLGHLIVDQRHVGLLAPDRLDRLTAVLGLGDDTRCGRLTQSADTPCAEERVIIRNDTPARITHSDDPFFASVGDSMKGMMGA